MNKSVLSPLFGALLLSASCSAQTTSSAPDVVLLKDDVQAGVVQTIRACFPHGQEFAGLSIHLILVTNVESRTRAAIVAIGDRSRLKSDPHFLEFAKVAVRASLTPACSGLPLPPALQGRVERLEIVFSV